MGIHGKSQHTCPKNPAIRLVAALHAQQPRSLQGLQLMPQDPLCAGGEALGRGLAGAPVSAWGRASGCEVQPLDVVQLAMQVHAGRAPLHTAPWSVQALSACCQCTQ